MQDQIASLRSPSDPPPPLGRRINHKQTRANYTNAVVRQYVIENAKVLEHVWYFMHNMKSVSLPTVCPKENQELSGAMREVDMIAAGQNIITLLEMVPNAYAGQCIEAAWPFTEIGKDLHGLKVNTYVLGFSPRFIIVMKGINSFNANRDAWLTGSLVPEAQYLATLSNARLELQVAPQVKDEHSPDRSESALP